MSAPILSPGAAYTNVPLVQDFLGRTLTAAEQVTVQRLLLSVQAVVETLCRQSWQGTTPVVGESYPLDNTGARLLLRSTPVLSVQQIQTRALQPGATPRTLTAGTDYELVDPTRGLVILAASSSVATTGVDYGAWGGDASWGYAGRLLRPGASYGAMALVSYTPNRPPPWDVRMAATQIVAHWLLYALHPERYGVAELRTADQALRLAGPNGIPILPADALALLAGTGVGDGHRRVLI